VTSDATDYIAISPAYRSAIQRLFLVVFKRDELAVYNHVLYVIGPPKDTFLRLRHDWHSRRWNCKRVFMIHNFGNTESWKDTDGNT